MIGQETELALSLKDIVQFEVPALFRRQHLNRDVAIGIIGDRGDGKSVSGAVITLLDYMAQKEPCWSNMQIAASFEFDDETALKYGLRGGEVEFHSRELDMVKLLTFDPEYKGGVFFVDEINIDLADARRSMANQNLAADDVGQQLRKLRSALIYTCIHEMFVDMRIRDMTDIFILTRDTALNPEGLARKKPPGLEFEWTIFPMTRKLTGERYQDTHRSLPPVYLHGRKWWGAIDSMERQVRTKYTIPMGKDTIASLDIQESPRVVEARSKWGWLYEKIKALHDQGIPEIHNEELWEYLQLRDRGIPLVVAGQQLSAMGIRKRKAPPSQGGCYYIIDQFDLKKGKFLDKKEAVLV